jgi:ADP-ribose pyrophosphatase YjhB (NUDIX family)/nicotinic acid mononucleotide adenylyltransferase
MAAPTRPALMADALVLAGSGEDMALLLVRRGRPPQQGELALPGGFVEEFEAPLQAACREALEETGLRLDARAAWPLALRARAGRDPRGWTISQPYLFHLQEPSPVQAGDDAAAADWVPLKEIERLAFDHGAMLCEALGLFWPGMPGWLPAFAGVEAFSSPRQALPHPVFFGGSFQPWHAGHEACLRAWKEAGTLVIVPDQNPDKPLRPLECAYASWRELRRIGEPLGALVFPGWLGRERPNPTASWFPHVQAQTRSLLMGEDSFADLPRWFQVESLLPAIDRLGVVPRKGAAASDQARILLASHAPRCRLLALDHHPWEHLSSSALRQAQP